MQLLEDIEALRRLKYEYFTAADANYDGDAVAALFTEDGVWEGGDLGRYQGRAAIRETFNSVKFSVQLALHYGTNPIIEVLGERAVCRWYLWLPKIAKDGTHRRISVGAYLDQCRRVGNGWLFEHMRLDMRTLPATEEG